MSRDPRIDAYIARQADFARPILDHIRAAVHDACPDVEESIKWSMPAFLLNGRPLANMAAFKAHASFGFWRGRELIGDQVQEGAMGQFGRLTSVDDLPPPATLAGLIRAAAAKASEGPAPRPKKPPKPDLPPPDDLRAALDAQPSAAATFDAFPPSCRREYVEWVVEAKRPETRAKRIAQAVEWMAEGRRRNWKYEGC
ncbi:MAG: YdeI/OmpD-associated family protein [Alphaproteobacteria bacterium]|nr:YdeI/OmpD-associated family protein [Alphaproteobacteria bacterium]